MKRWISGAWQVGARGLGLDPVLEFKAKSCLESSVDSRQDSRLAPKSGAAFTLGSSCPPPYEFFSILGGGVDRVDDTHHTHAGVFGVVII